MHWHFHYTGIDIFASKWLYMQRDSASKKLQFVRLHYTNYLKGRGFEVFTNSAHFGVVVEPKLGVEYAGSSRAPFYSYTVRIGYVGFGGRTPKWLERRLQAKLDAEMEAYAAAHGEVDDMPQY